MLSTEIPIVKRIISELLSAGFQLSVQDAEGRESRRVCSAGTTTVDGGVFILRRLEGNPHARLFVFDPAARGSQSDEILFVFGNGHAECVSDYTLGVEGIIGEVFADDDRRIGIR